MAVAFFLYGSMMIYHISSDLMFTSDLWTNQESLPEILEYPDPKLLAAYYQVCKEPRATREVLRRFRHFYPEAFLYMTNDGGDTKHIPEIAVQYGPIINWNASDVINQNSWKAPGFEYLYLTKPTSSNHVSLFFDDPNASIGLVERIIYTAKRAGSKWVLLLEDDVWIYDLIGGLSGEELRFNLVGSRSDVHFNEHTRAALESVLGRTLKQTNYAGSGGSLIRSSILFKLDTIRDQWHEWVRRIVHFLRSRGRTIASDELITCLVYLVDGTVGQYPGLTEFWDSDNQERVRTRNLQVFHVQKVLYKKWYEILW